MELQLDIIGQRISVAIIGFTATMRFGSPVQFELQVEGDLDFRTAIDGRLHASSYVRQSQGYAGRSNSPFWMLAVKVSHAVGVKVSAGPVGFLESRTPIWPPGRCATSTQSPLGWL